MQVTSVADIVVIVILVIISLWILLRVVIPIMLNVYTFMIVFWAEFRDEYAKRRWAKKEASLKDE